MNLIPKEQRFFALFNRQAKDVMKAACLLKEMVGNYHDIEGYAERCSEIEHEADITAHEIIDKLNRTFVTPIDREDILDLAHALDDVVDLIDGSIGRARLYSIPEPTQEMKELAEIIYRSVNEITKALEGLDDMKNVRRILDYCIEINRLENEGDAVLRRAIRNLLANTVDAMEFLKWKEIYEALEQAIDKCEDVANIIEGVLIKNA